MVVDMDIPEYSELRRPRNSYHDYCNPKASLVNELEGAVGLVGPLCHKEFSRRSSPVDGSPVGGDI